MLSWHGTLVSIDSHMHQEEKKVLIPSLCCKLHFLSWTPLPPASAAHSHPQSQVSWLWSQEPFKRERLAFQGMDHVQNQFKGNRAMTCALQEYVCSGGLMNCSSLQLGFRCPKGQYYSHLILDRARLSSLCYCTFYCTSAFSQISYLPVFTPRNSIVFWPHG